MQLVNQEMSQEKIKLKLVRLKYFSLNQSIILHNVKIL